MQATTSTPIRSVVLADDPGLAGEVEVAENVDAARSDALSRSGADKLQQRVAGRAVAVFLGSAEALGMDRQHRDSFLPAHALADGLDVVADHAHDAGGVDEGGFGLVGINRSVQCAA
jgi:hypothetical protein